MINLSLPPVREILKRLIKEKSVKKAVGYANFMLSKKLPYFFSPLSMRISITNRCNLNCLFCSNQYTKDKKKDMSFEEFKYILGQFPFLEEVNLTSFGESFLNKDFFLMLEYLKKRRISAWCIDNFDLLNEKTARDLVNVGTIKKIYASIDGGDKATFEMLRGGAKFEDVVGNIKLLERQKLILNKKFPEIKLICTVSMKNIQNMGKIVELAKELNLKEVLFSPLLIMDNYSPGYEELIKTMMPSMGLYQEEGKKAVQKGRELGVNVCITEIKRFATDCYKWLWNEVDIGYDGAVWPCCRMDYGGDEKKNVPYGNIFKESFRRIWLSDRYRLTREKLSKGELVEACRYKGFCEEGV
ncbi:MAG: radical SAM protein [Candidatus Omnitrophica bacterium]|nr:radical SAM protein [Candidatus Omnitrophota bacterium]